MDCAADDACVGHLGCGNRLPSRDTTDTLMHIMTRANLRLWLMHGTAFSRVPQVGKALYWDSRKPNSHAPCETKMPKPLLTHYDPITEKVSRNDKTWKVPQRGSRPRTLAPVCERRRRRPSQLNSSPLPFCPQSTTTCLLTCTSVACSTAATSATSLLS